MLKYLIDNKEWIFSGIGVFLLATVVGIIQYILKRKRVGSLKDDKIINEQSFNERTKDKTLINKVEFTNITVKNIIDKLHNTPPFQRDTLSNNYKGLKVRWEGKLWNVEKETYTDKSEKTVRVVFHPIPKNLHYRVLLTVDIDRYPQLKIIKRGSKIAAEGEIINCSSEGMYVEIKPSKLLFLKSH
ncbi:hypothetical protein ACFL0B_03910 [Thermodesulfobacteriota bacterium]